MRIFDWEEGWHPLSPALFKSTVHHPKVPLRVLLVLTSSAFVLKLFLILKFLKNIFVCMCLHVCLGGIYINGWRA